VEYSTHPFMEAYDYALTSERPEQAPLPVRIRARVQGLLDPAIERIKPVREWAKRQAGR
jgi:hypothetical protein